MAELVATYADELLAVRRDLHAHPEVAHREVRSTALLVNRLTREGLSPQTLPGTGLTCDIGDPRGRTVALRADLDALQLPETTGLPFASTEPGVSHACGHDVHTAVVLGAGLVLAELHRQGRLPGRVRLIFQPAEEVMPGGALNVVAGGGLDGVDRAYALHCDPAAEVGAVGCRPGPITSACDLITVRLSGDGGHTSRPHLTQDLVFALAQVITQVPAVLSRRVDPRAGVALVWGRVTAGGAANAIPGTGEVAGTLRCLDAGVWASAAALVGEAVREVVGPYGVRAEIDHVRGVPPTVNDPDAVLLAEEAVEAELGEGHISLAEQSLGGEDFAWILEKVPGAMLRLGTRTPGGRRFDLHQGDLVVDEGAVAVGVRVLVAIALRELAHTG